MAEVRADGTTAGGNAAFHNFHNDFAHIQDPNERRRLALAEIDKAPFGWYHVRAIVVAGVGFFTDQYDIFTASFLTIMLGIVYEHSNNGKLHVAQDTAIKVATSAGTVLGQFGFGALADILGRKKMYGIELILIIIATLAQTMLGSGPGVSIVGTMIFWRVIMGIGEYLLFRSSDDVTQLTNSYFRYRWRLPSVFYHHFRVCFLPNSLNA